MFAVVHQFAHILWKENVQPGNDSVADGTIGIIFSPFSLPQNLETLEAKQGKARQKQGRSKAEARQKQCEAHRALELCSKLGPPKKKTRRRKICTRAVSVNVLSF